MANANITAEIAEAEKLGDLSGMGMPEELKEAYKSEVESEEESKPAPKEETEEVESKEAEEETEEEIEDEVVEKEAKPREPRPAKNERPLKALFSQIKELRDEIKSLKTTPAKAEVKEAIDEIETYAEKHQLDASGLKELSQLIEKNLLGKLEKDGKLSKDLPEEITEKLKILDELQAEKKDKAEKEYFEKEYTKILPEIQKQYPNAKAGELSEAKAVLDELAHSKEWKDKDLDYIIFKNKSKFDTLLKVAKHNKSGETASKQMIDDTEEESEIDLDPENMTPEKAKAFERARLNRN